MKKPKVEIGQCYEYEDHIFMIVEGPFTQGACKSEYWIVEDTVEKKRWPEHTEFILTLHRPFQNYG